MTDSDPPFDSGPERDCENDSGSDSGSVSDSGGDAARVAELELEDSARIRRSAEIEHERAVAVYDLLEANHFVPRDLPPGPYHLRLGIEENRLIFDIRDMNRAELARVPLSLRPFRRIVHDYFLICESYYDAIKTASLQQIEAIDMGRRGLHNEGSELLRERLAERVEIDADTARRLFTLLCVLHIKGG